MRFHSSQPTPRRPSAVCTVAHARAKLLTRPSGAINRTGPCPCTAIVAVIGPGSNVSVVVRGNPLSASVASAVTELVSVTSPVRCM